MITDQTLRYLDLVALLGKFSRVPLQIALVGGPEIWDKLPPKGALSVEKVALRIALPDDVAEPGLGRDPEERLPLDADAVKSAPHANFAGQVPLEAPVIVTPATVKPAGHPPIRDVEETSWLEQSGEIKDGSEAAKLWGPRRFWGPRK